VPFHPGNCLQAFEVVDGDAAVIHLQQAGLFQHLQGLVGTLARGTGEIADFFLRNLQVQPMPGFR
jgi:hypothetical protein